MGICHSKYNAPYTYFPEIKIHQELFTLLGLTEEEVGKIYKCFKAIDCNETNDFFINDIFDYLHIENTFFNNRIFKMMDHDDSGKINFAEFVLGLWNYCSIEDEWFGVRTRTLDDEYTMTQLFYLSSMFFPFLTTII